MFTWPPFLWRASESTANRGSDILLTLGGITEGYMESPRSRFWFWQGVTKKLDGLSLSATERKKIETQIAKTVPRLTKREAAKLKAQESANAVQLRALAGQIRSITR